MKQKVEMYFDSNEENEQIRNINYRTLLQFFDNAGVPEEPPRDFQ